MLYATLAGVAAFGQGKIGFTTDSLHLVYYDPETVALGGAAVSAANMFFGTLVADLYMGTSSSSLSYYSTTTFGAAPGKWNLLNVQATANGTTGAPAILGGTSVFVEVQIRDQAFAAPTTFSGIPFGGYYGTSQMFQFTLGSSVTYPVMYNAPGWAQGTFALDATAGAGAKGAIAVGVPEPSTFALCGLGAAALMNFRRRK